MRLPIFALSALFYIATANVSGKQYGSLQEETAIEQSEAHITARQASRTYTITFTIFWYEYTYYTSTVTTETPSETRTGVGFDFTSSRLRLTTAARSSDEAYDLLKPTADSVSSSKESSEESASRSMYEVISLQYRSSSRSASLSRSIASSASDNFGTSHRPLSIRISDSLAVAVTIVAVGLVGSLMVLL